MADDKTLYLLDGHALVYRAHYAFVSRPLINSKGLNTSAVAGFVRALLDILQKQRPSHLGVAFDVSEVTFRNALYPAYKANREAQPEDIGIAFPYIRRILEGMGIPIVEMPGYEADDVIGTLAKKAEKEGFKVFMVTPDKDYSQLVSEHIFLYKPARMGNEVEVYDVPMVLEKWGIRRIEQVADVLGLQGDAVDNIPGIPGIGPKTAVQLLAAYDTVENLIAHADELKGKQRERVREFAEQALLSKRLATIDTDVPIAFDAAAFAISPPDKALLAEVFKELEFRSLAAQVLGMGEEAPAERPSAQGSLFGEAEAAAPPPDDAPPAHSVAELHIGNTPHAYHLADDAERRAALLDHLLAQNSVCFDSETTGIDPNDCELVGLSFAWQKGEAWYMPLPADRAEAMAILAPFKAFFENEHIGKTGQNIKYDLIVLRWYGIEVRGPLFDTMLAHYLYEPELRHNMDYMAETYLRYKPVKIEALIGKGKGQLSMRDVPIDKVKDYAAEDADITWQLRGHFEPILREQQLEALFYDMEIPLVRVLAEIEYNGIRVDAAYLEQYSVELGGKIAALEQQIYEQAGVRFNIGSPKQVGEVLFERLKIPYRWSMTKTGQYATDEEKMSELATEHAIVQTIMDFRGLSKLKSTYVDALPRMINPRTGRVHTSLNQALTATGRLSSNNPNLQNIPIRTEEGRRVREAFVPRDAEHVLLAADYSQIELRLIAELSGDAAMLEAFQNGLDIHRATAARVYGVAYEAVSADQRRNAKTVNFAIVYGAGASNLSKSLGISRTDAKALIDNYFAQYSGLKAYMDGVVEQARQQGHVSTLLGRRRYLRDIDSRNAVMRGHAERNAINSPVQGSAADMIKMAMVRIHAAMQAGGFRSKMVLQVHDELLFDVYRPELEALRPLIDTHMRQALPNLRVPIEVGMGWGEHWLEAH